MNKWLTMHSSIFEGMLRRASRGEDPEILLIEFYANCETEAVDGS